MKTHMLKIHSQYFYDVKSGRKTFEIRKNDRLFKAGDLLFLSMYEPLSNTYRDQHLLAEITYMTNLKIIGKEDYAVLGIKLIDSKFINLSYLFSLQSEEEISKILNNHLPF